MTRVAMPLAVLLLSCASTAVAQSPPDVPVVVARGQATIKRAPDQAWVAIAAEGRAATPAEAQRVAAGGMTAVQAALAKAGLPADAIKTTGAIADEDALKDAIKAFADSFQPTRGATAAEFEANADPGAHTTATAPTHLPEDETTRPEEDAH